MLKQILRIFACALLIVGEVFGQTAIAPNVRELLPSSATAPNNPVFLSPIGVVFIAETRRFAPALKARGDVSEQKISKSVLSENQDWKKHPQPPRMRPETSLLFKYDQKGHEVEHYEENIFASSWTRRKQEFEGGRLVSQTVESGNGPDMSPRDLVQVKYAGDRVMEITKEQGNGPQMHVVNFEYDPAGRVMRYEYRLNAKSGLTVRTEIKYTDDTVETKTLLPNGRVAALQTQTLDARGRVVDLRVSHAQGEKLAVLCHASFRYDDKDRVIEQIGDPRDLGTGSDWSPDGLPQPGRATLQYDDPHLTRTQEFYKNGKVFLRAVAQLDRNGEELSVRVFDGEGIEKEYDERVPNATSGKPERKRGKCAWEMQYDSQGNWIGRTLWFTPADGGPRVLLTKYERTITYR